MDWSQDKLNSLLTEWQRILRLQDWDMRIKLARDRDMVHSGRQGECEITPSNKNALIRVLDPVDYPPSEWEQDVEDTIVHELLHIHMVPFDPEPNTPAQTMQEQAINSIASALVSLKRRVS